ncbi:hypothetical protein DL89DRAFT_63901 [Linderina pennispora]|uniref:Uncharacterized protein n=1 Tax=Linderina pennispora TaxID=61395 RepID=A0A1Y1VYV0_9FUNG|nr:uncharacterized protein DL89DRAFT_63901 [Linderina pennispora]ORX66448.1 hypothetical protein DL89DRAFT_63901 [Linderina pennispora]
MRYRSPQAQLLILYGVFLINGCIPALTVRSATGIVSPEHRLEYAGTWKQQMTYGLSFIAGIFAVNLLGARVVLFFGGLCGILYAAGIICVHKYSIHGLLPCRHDSKQHWVCNGDAGSEHNGADVSAGAAEGARSGSVSDQPGAVPDIGRRYVQILRAARGATGTRRWCS